MPMPEDVREKTGQWWTCPSIPARSMIVRWSVARKAYIKETKAYHRTSSK